MKVLRVWWEDSEAGYSSKFTRTCSGVSLGPISDDRCYASYLVVRRDDGKVVQVALDDITKSEWVAV